MNFSIDTSDIDLLRKRFESFSDRRFQSAMAEAVNGTARAIRDEWGGQLFTRFDRPKQLTWNAARSTTADVGRLTAEVSITDKIGGVVSDEAPRTYVAVHEFGGDRGVKKFERALQAGGAMPRGHKAVPGKYARLDQFGNVSRQQIVQVLNQLGDKLSPGYRQVISEKVGKRAKSASRAGRVYVAVPKDVGRLEAGIYERRNDALLPVFFFVPSLRYTARLDLMSHAERMVRQQFSARVSAALDKRMQSLIRRNSSGI